MKKEHTLIWSAFLHLFPGVLIVLIFVLVAPMFRNAGIAVIFSILLAIVVVLVPFELGVILAASKKEFGSYSLKSALLYTRPIPLSMFILLVAFLFLWSGISPVACFLFGRTNYPVVFFLAALLVFYQ